MEFISEREKLLQSVRDHQGTMKDLLPKLKELLVIGHAAYDKLVEVTDAEQEMRDKHMPAVPRPIPDIDEHLTLLAIELQWIRRLIEDIESA